MEGRGKVAAVLGTVALLLLLLIGGVGLSTQVLGGPGAAPKATGVTIKGYAVIDGTLVLSVSHAGCDEVAGTTVDESTDEVDVSVRLRRTSDVCVGMQKQEQVRVTLEDPLGSRGVFDRACVKAEKPRQECRVSRTQGGPKRT